MTTYDGVKDKCCANCGADLREKGSVKCIAFLDGENWHQQQFECIKCGNKITVTIKDE